MCYRSPEDLEEGEEESCKEHDPAFARWTGFWPGLLESQALGIDLNQFYQQDYHKIFFVKPIPKE
jgi:hypothetical protein